MLKFFDPMQKKNVKCFSTRGPVRLTPQTVGYYVFVATGGCPHGGGGAPKIVKTPKRNENRAATLLAKV
jgi:hypothetical protein